VEEDAPVDSNDVDYIEAPFSPQELGIIHKVRAPTFHGEVGNGG